MYTHHVTSPQLDRRRISIHSDSQPISLISTYVTGSLLSSPTLRCPVLHCAVLYYAVLCCPVIEHTYTRHPIGYSLAIVGIELYRLVLLMSYCADNTIDQITTQLNSSVSPVDYNEYIIYCQACNQLTHTLQQLQPSSTVTAANHSLDQLLLYFEQSVIDTCRVNTGLNHCYALDINNRSLKQPHQSNGLISVKPLALNELCVSIPRQLMLCSDTIFNTDNNIDPSLQPYYNVLSNDELISQDHSMILTLLLYYHKYVLSNKSSYAAYINILPHSHTLPLYQSVDVLCNNIQGGSTLIKILQHQMITLQQYCYIYQLFKTRHIPIPTYHQFLWCVATVCSRQNNIPMINGDSNNISCRALIPLFDLMNHSIHGTIVTDYNITTHSLESYTVDSLNVAEPLLMNYGNRSNTELYMYQGFIDQHNKHNIYDLIINLPDTDLSTQLYKIKYLMLNKVQMTPIYTIQLPLPYIPKLYQQQLESDNIDSAQHAKLQHDNDTRWYNMLHYLRVYCIINDDMSYALKTQAHHKKSMLIMPLSRPNEISVFSVLKQLLQLELEKFTSTLESDIELSMSCTITDTTKLAALQQRINDKQLLHDAIQLVNKWTLNIPTFIVEDLPPISDYQ